MIQRIRGTRDMLDTTLLNFALKTITQQVKLHHFHEIITPILEPTELFSRSLGTETDVVSKEMFIVSSSSAQGDESICLRPEATASTIRAFVEGGIDQLPWKVFSFGPMFRYERPQKGRYRQFYQFNIECIGTANLTHDVRLISMLDRLFSTKFGLVNYALHLNFLGTPEERAAFKATLTNFLDKQTDICDTCKKRKVTNVLRVFDCKQEACQAIYKNAPQLADAFGAQSQQEWQQLQDQLQQLSVSFVINSKLVRGLDYYNKTVFEFVSSNLGAQSAFCGGGRYDHLVSQIGGKQDQPSIGAAIGIDRLLVLLELIQNQLPLEHEPKLYAILPLALEQQMLALHYADTLTKAGKVTEIIADGSVKSMMRKANKLGANQVLIIGDKEQQEGTVVLKDMVKGTEQIVKQADILKHL